MLTFFYKTKTHLNFNYALCIVNYELFLGVPAKPSGFPLYLFPLRYKRMPLQSLTHWRLQIPSRKHQINNP